MITDQYLFANKKRYLFMLNKKAAFSNLSTACIEDWNSAMNG